MKLPVPDFSDRQRTLFYNEGHQVALLVKKIAWPYLFFG